MTTSMTFRRARYCKQKEKERNQFVAEVFEVISIETNHTVDIATDDFECVITEISKNLKDNPDWDYTDDSPKIRYDAHKNATYTIRSMKNHVEKKIIVNNKID